MRLVTARQLTAGMALLVTACSGADPADSYVRGRGLKVASLSADAESRIFGAAVGAAFDVSPTSRSACTLVVFRAPRATAEALPRKPPLCARCATTA
ncbi:MAG: hypothetical protein M3Z05_14400 [Gemmatimonadota bacterium]|nr:hypothetical protein [Gemmatimonadota bacterium]